MRSLALAVSFLTRLPVDPGPPSPGSWGRAAAFFPAAGVIVGLAVALGLTVGGFVSPLVAGCLGATANVLVTGALHLDGLSDCADGLAAGGDTERRLAVMRDPRAGAVGAAAAALAVLGRAALYAACMERGVLLPAAWIAAIAARIGLAFELGLARPATPGKGLFAHLAAEVRAPALVGATVLGAVLLAPAVLVVPDTKVPTLAGLGAAILVTLGWHRWWRARIGGSTGDVCGAATELRELVVLFALSLTPAD